jgi:hypothetical protein
MIQLAIADLEALAPSKPQGYLAACLAAGTVQDGVLTLTPEAFARIRRQFAPPSIARQAASLGRAVASECRSIMAGVDPVSDTEKAARLAVCSECEFLLASENRCAKCGCNLAAKAAMRSQRCPLGKWPVNG